MLFETVVEAIETSGKTRNRISVETGIDPAVLHRIVHGGTCSIGTLDKLCEYLGLALQPMARKGKVTHGKHR